MKCDMTSIRIRDITINEQKNESKIHKIIDRKYKAIKRNEK